MSFDAQPVLEGPTIRLRPLTPRDFDALFAVAGDPLLWEQHPERDRYRPEVFRRFFDGAIASGGALVVETHDARVIGSSRFHAYDERRSEVEIGWTFLARGHWGGATNRELKRLMLDHAFRYVERVVFVVGPGNRRSQRALEKLGAQRAGTRLDGAGQMSIVYELSRTRYPSLTMPDHPLVFVATNKLKPGAVDAERRRVADLIAFIDREEPQLLGFHEYVNADGTEVTVVQIHPDAESLRRHVAVVAERAAAAYRETLDGTLGIQIYGQIDDEMLDGLRAQTGDQVTLTVAGEHLGAHTRPLTRLIRPISREACSAVARARTSTGDATRAGGAVGVGGRAR